jgi:hypothetical protein
VHAPLAAPQLGLAVVAPGVGDGDGVLVVAGVELV